MVNDSADAVSAKLAIMKAPAGKDAQLNDTREKELVPAILKGNDDEAKKIAGGVQKERYTKCQTISSVQLPVR